jgi:acetylornithine deacetylase
MTKQINAGKQHNVVPAECHLVVDIRVNDCYSNQEILDTVRANVAAEINPRSMHFFHSCFSWIGAGRNRIRKNHLRLATLSDQSVLSCKSLKLGPGETLRSHSANEFIFIHEITEGIQLYIKILIFFKQ